MIDCFFLLCCDSILDYLLTLCFICVTWHNIIGSVECLSSLHPLLLGCEHLICVVGDKDIDCGGEVPPFAIHLHIVNYVCDEVVLGF